MIYKAYLKQFGEGCDYTIGCGHTIIDIDGDNPKEAEINLYKYIEENYGSSLELSVCELYEINNILECDYDSYKLDQENIKMIKLKEQQDNKEFEEYLRLKNKFENKL